MLLLFFYLIHFHKLHYSEEKYDGKLNENSNK